MAYQPFIPRRAQVIVSVARPDAQGNTQQQTYTFSDHRMRIAVRQGGKQFGNAKVEIFGAPLDTMNQIARLWLEALTPQNTDTLTINVWDGEGFIPFFVGVIAWSAVNASGMPHVALEIEANAAMTGSNAVASPYAAQGPIALQDVLTTLAQRAELTLDYASTAPTYQLASVRTTGSPVEQIGAVMAYFPDLTWTINLQRLIVRKALAPYEDAAVRIAADTGLVGYPVYSTSGLQFATVFNPQLRPGLSLDVQTPFDFVNRTVWVTAVLAHTLDVNYPGGQWLTQVAANAFGAKGNNNGQSTANRL